MVPTVATMVHEYMNNRIDSFRHIHEQIVKKYHHHLYNVYNTNTRHPGAVGSNDAMTSLIIRYSKKLQAVFWKARTRRSICRTTSTRILES